MKRKVKLFITAASTLAIVFAVGWGGPAAAAGWASPAAKVATASSPLGRIIVDGKGRTLYLFEKDRGRTSACYGYCASLWPPYTVKAKPAAGRGVLASKLGTTRRRDGKLEVTYNGHPLYYYAGDAKRGETNGQGLNDAGAAWYVLAPSGKKIGRS